MTGIDSEPELLVVCVDSPDDPCLVARGAWHTCWQR